MTADPARQPTHLPLDPVTATDVRGAFARGEFFLSYQPKIDLASGRTVGAEALIRWRRGNRILSPGSFLPVVEAEDLSPALFSLVVQKLPADLERFRRVGNDLHVSINASPPDLQAPEPAERLQDLIRMGRLEGREIQVEVTESAVLMESPNLRRVIGVLLDTGAELVMDDFGTGYSSIDVLSRFPFAWVKLDGGLIRRMGASIKTYRIVKAILTLARDLRIGTVAEGVESAADYLALQFMGCRQAQGYFIAPPLSPDEFIALLSDHRNPPASATGTVIDAQANLHSFRHAVVTAFIHRVMLDDPDADSSIAEMDIERNARNSRVGRWYYGQGQAFKHLAVFQAIELPHERLRAAAAQLIEASRKADTDHDALLALMDRFNARFRMVDRLLAALLSAVLTLERQGQGGMADYANPVN